MIAAKLKSNENAPEKIPFRLSLFTYFSFCILIFIGYIKDTAKCVTSIMQRIFLLNKKNSPPPLMRSFENFFTRHLYRKVSDCWNRPISGPAGALTTVSHRMSADANRTFTLTGHRSDCINMGSYNYLGFGGKLSEHQQKYVTDAMEQYGITTCSNYSDFGRYPILTELEQLVAGFLHKEDSVCIPMGFATNSTVICELVGPGCCIFSDELNHASIVLGSRLSGAKIVVFPHNNLQMLDRLLKDTILTGQQHNGKPFKKILIIVEGIYSMEGDIVDLKRIVQLKKKYKAYLMVDEAHSIGAIGGSGRGVSEYTNVDTRDIDVMMGTFTKSFGAVGGYIAGDRRLINYLRNTSLGLSCCTAMPPVVAAQTYYALRYLIDNGQHLLSNLQFNVNYFRNRIKNLKNKLIVLGNDDSPVVPILLCIPGVVAEFSRYMLKHNIAVVVVGFPATPVISSRARICISSAHTKEQLDRVADRIEAFCSKYFFSA